MLNCVSQEIKFMNAQYSTGAANLYLSGSSKCSIDKMNYIANTAITSYHIYGQYQASITHSVFINNADLPYFYISLFTLTQCTFDVTPSGSRSTIDCLFDAHNPTLNDICCTHCPSLSSIYTSLIITNTNSTAGWLFRILLFPS